MRRGRLPSLNGMAARNYYRIRGVSTADIVTAAWHKSIISTYNGSCFELARLRSDLIGVRDTKDRGQGPVLVFNQDEWDAFRSGVKAGEFDLL
jgi:Domain of unknown function (DUF397)